jgi:hypothetical protein
MLYSFSHLLSAHEPVHLLSSYFSSDGYKTLLQPVGSDPKVDSIDTIRLCCALNCWQDPSLFLAIYPPRVPRWLRSTLSWVIENFIGDRTFATLARDARPKSVAEYLQLTVRRKALGRRMKHEIWDKHKLDAIIAPVQAMPTIPHGYVVHSSPDLFG